MFSGLVETVGEIVAIAGENPRRLSIRSRLDGAGIKIGDSIAINGCCLTVVANEGALLSFEAATETLRLTTLGALRVGDFVNLEQALRVSDRLGGHIVSGHIDGVGRVQKLEQIGGALYVTVAVPAELSRYIAARGSITVAGVSLTVNDVAAATFVVSLIPHTLAVTTFGALKEGDTVNIEVDLLARYLERLSQT